MLNTKKTNKRITLYSAIFTLLAVVFIFAIFFPPYLFLQESNFTYLIGLIIFDIVSGVVIFYFLTRKIRLRKKLLAQEFPKEWTRILNSNIAYFSSLSEEEKSIFQQEVLIFLGEKDITGIEVDIDARIKLSVAVSAIIPIFKYPDWEYDTLSEILIYPNSFDDNYNFNAKNKNILGLVTNGGSTMVLSKPSLLHGFEDSKDKLNVGLHEFSHKIDGEDGQIDGIPSLMIDSSQVNKWLSLIKSESKKIKDGKSDINPYALTNNAEFFAVVTEYFFENPQAMSQKHPALYSMLKNIFKQDTKSMFLSTVRSMFRPKGKKLGRNSPCPCGSGKKYKRCCLDKKRYS